jgi:hypothetical protein
MPGVEQEEDDSRRVWDMRHILTTIVHEEKQMQTILRSALGAAV